MYVTRVEIENIKCFRHLVWEIDAGDARGWHVILGDNGAGKSTFTRSVAICILGNERAQALRQDWSEWISIGKEEGFLRIDIKTDPEIDFIGLLTSSRKNDWSIGLALLRSYMVSSGRLVREPHFFI